MKTGKQILKILALILLICVTLLLLVLLVMIIYAKGNVSYEADEALFISAKENKGVKLYYNATPDKDKYTACELCTVTASSERRSWLSYDEIGDNIKRAFLSAEDREFFDHQGVNFKRTAYAALNYAFGSKKRFGGSTITQQVIKNISGDDEFSLKRKINEILRAIHIEDVYTKEEIFELYLNIVPMGNSVLGVGCASNLYFNKEANELTVPEAATLVGITNAPTRYDPYKNPEACLAKRNRVLYAMLDYGEITEDEYATYTEAPLSVRDKSEETREYDSWFAETVFGDASRDLARKLSISQNAARILLLSGGYSIYTTVNPKIQNILDQYFEDESNFPYAIKDGLNYSMVVSDIHGNILGIVGGVGNKSGNRVINAATIPRPPASALKPLALYAPLIESGLADWSSVFDDTPYTFYKSNEGEYVDYPKNSPDSYSGLITLADALRLSKNSVAAKIYDKLGKERIFKHLQKSFGMTELVESEKGKSGMITDKALSPLALGQLSHGISLRKLVNSYTCFPGDGMLSTQRTYISICDAEGNTVIDNEQASERVFTKETSRIMNKMLEGVVKSGTARSITLDEIVPTAGKTGTSGNSRDKLFIGYTPYIVAGIWCGYNDSSRSVGAQAISHLSVWDSVMKMIHEEIVKDGESIMRFSTEGLEYLPYCMDSGKLFCDTCIKDPRNSRLGYGYFVNGKGPRDICDIHVLCENEEGKTVALLDIPTRDFPVDIVVCDSEYIYSSYIEKREEVLPPSDYEYNNMIFEEKKRLRI